MFDFVRNNEQRELLNKLEALIPAFKQREPDLTQLNSYPKENIEDLKQIDYQTLTMPTEYGGQGMGLYSFVLAQELIAKGSGSTALSIGWHGGSLLEWSENRNWDKDIAEWLTKKIIDGAIINTAATEKGAGSPTRGALPQTTAVEKDGSWVITGEKSYTSLAPLIDYFFVTAAIGDTDSVAVFVVPKETKGVSINETWDSVGMRGTASHDLVLNEAVIPKSYLLKPLNGERKMNPQAWLLHIPACYIGIAGAARDEAVAFASNYTPVSLGEPIGSLVNIQQQIGEMDIELISARQALYHAALVYEEAENKAAVKDLLQAAKVNVTNAAISIVDRAMRIVGPSAMSASSPMQRYYKDVRMGLHNPPMEDMVKKALGEKAVELDN
ncbi:acyl-CoA dehydrogenase family protein [Jeotgalibacillus proteolyticus]|uniref:Acyl-CoA dehydrogenase n=1 Tax=Jeotgalibacillus proteolyticus TaxID=2082395 RepID=A0A2S5G9Q1_9BACL|nr:acyl-CoA dehydrogenase family protein [Jeotgalibacillus proteolyticus]PPA69732.1 acyl-CoA dehydrogenase [Jeotgalibacillus proteolyticus]